MDHVVSLSGGKDSTAMLFMLLERGYPVDRVVFCDTTKEFDEMYTHIDAVEAMLFKNHGIRLERVSFDFDYYFSEIVKTNGVNAGKKGYGFPGFRTRWCTRMKIGALNSVLSTPRIQYVGFASDEPEREERHIFGGTRVRGETKRFPLIEFGVTESEALYYCYKLGFDWGGLYEKFDRVSCWMCPLKGIHAFKKIWRHFPEKWKELEEMQKRSQFPLLPGYSVSQLRERFEREHPETMCSAKNFYAQHWSYRQGVYIKS
jgi:3'-phosphoadenosine 5'-phosphosulfate sulfotransferase (PAPS reductase)/FAD synthetase